MKTVLRVWIVLSFILSACVPAAAPVPPAPTVRPEPTTNAVAPTDTLVPSPTLKPAPTHTPPAAGPDPQKMRSDLDAMLQKVTDRGLFSGAVLVARDGQIVLSKGYGLADREQKIPNTPQTKFRVAQLTQSFTALAIMLLQEQGKLNVTDKVCQYFKDCPPTWKDITIHQLLTHTAGLPEIIDTDAYRLIQGESTTPQQLIALFHDAPLAYQPGKSFNITPLGFGASDYVVLGKLIEQVSGQAYESFVQQALLEPLTLTHSSFDQSAGDLASGYFDQASARTTPHRIIPYAAGSLYSTVEDLHRWIQTFAGDGPFSSSILREVLKPQVENPVDQGWDVGYGWYLGTFADRQQISQSGDTDGYRSVIDWYPDDRLVIIVLVNQETVAPFSISEVLAKKILGVK